MRHIFVNQIKNYLRNPVTYLLCLVVTITMFFDLNPFMKDIPYEGDEKGEYYTSGDYDIQQGYIPLPSEERMIAVLDHLGDELSGSYGMTNVQTKKVISKIKEESMQEDEIITFLRNNYGFDIDKTYFNNVRVKKATHEEIKKYVEDRLERNRITEYFGRKFSDLLGVHTTYIVIVLSLFIFFNDIKKKSYEVLISKPIRNYDYVLGKILGCAVIVIIELLVIAIVCSIYASIVYGEDIYISSFDILKYVITLNFIPACFLISLVALITLVFKNPLPSIPVPIIMTIYSNQGVYDDMGTFGYKLKLFSTLVRFPGLFFETGISHELRFNIMINNIMLIALMVVIIYASIKAWDKVRI